MWSEALSGSDDDPHRTWLSASEVHDSKLTFHQIIILCDLLWCASLLDVGEEGQKNVLGKGSYICLSKSGSQRCCTILVAKLTMPVDPV